MVAEAIRPATLEELSEVVRGASSLSIVGNDGHRAWRFDQTLRETVLSLRGLSGIVSLEPADQVVIVRAGTLVSELNAELAKIGQTIPFAPFELDDDPSIGGALSLALPHRLEGQCGTWRDWMLGLTVVRPDGAVAKCGSSAVKNVAGYDVGRMFIGARGALGVIAEVILRTFPLKALPRPTCEGTSSGDAPLWAHRVRLGDFSLLQPPGVIDPATATLWTTVENRPRFDGDWVIRRGNTDPTPIDDLTRRALARFDPTGKLNPGALGL